VQGVAPVGPPGIGIVLVAEHIGNAVAGAVAAGQTRLADVPRQQFEGDARAILYVAERIVGAETLLARQEHAGDAGDHDEAQDHRDHQLDQGEAAVAVCAARPL